MKNDSLSRMKLPHAVRLVLFSSNATELISSATELVVLLRFKTRLQNLSFHVFLLQKKGIDGLSSATIVMLKSEIYRFEIAILNLARGSAEKKRYTVEASTFRVV